MFKSLGSGVIFSVLLSSASWSPLAGQTTALQSRSTQGATDAPYGISLPSEEFTLSNGLRVVVHTDRTTPVVAVNIWYHVGSRNEPAGRTGFAHLFEHLMFQGSENYHDEYFRPFELVGATDRNGTTTFDRTNYYQTVPTPALDLALWMESDRMGHLLGAIDQKTLNEQRGVVQNEKRQRYGQPYGLVIDRLYSAIFPQDHPYHHMPIGSMADLDAASLDDVKGWFKSWYGPNNATLVLAGDIDLATARKKVSRYFGDISPSATVQETAVDVPRHSEDTREIFLDKVPQAAIYRAWPSASFADPDNIPLQLLAQILGSSGSSRLRARLVQNEGVATSVSAGFQGMEVAGVFMVRAMLKEGVAPSVVEKIIDEEIRRIIETGPTAEELERARSVMVSGYLNGLSKVSSRADLLNQCVTLTRRARCWQDDMKVLASTTPESLRAVARRWLARGSHTIEVAKSDVAAASRPEATEPSAKRVPMAVPAPDPRFKPSPSVGIDRKAGPPTTVDFPKFSLPKIQHAVLSNGMKVALVERHGAPLVSMYMFFPSGSTAVDLAAGNPPLRGLMAMGMISRGAGPYDALQLSGRIEALGASVLPGASRDGASILVNALKINLPATLDIAADMLLRPAIDPDELARYKDQTIAGIRESRSVADSATGRLLSPLIFGESHPYGRMRREEDVTRITRNDLLDYLQTRLDPAGAQIVVAGDATLAEVVPMLEQSFASLKPHDKIESPQIPDVDNHAKSRVFLIDQPGVPQSTIRVAQIAPEVDDTMESDSLEVGNRALGGGFTSRLNLDLREERHWSYGVSSSFSSGYFGQRLWVATAPVQADRTADTITVMLSQITRLRDGQAPVSAAEIEKARSALYALPSSLETNFAVTSAVSGILIKGWPEDYHQRYITRIRTMSPQQATTAFSKTINPNAFTWVVMGPLDKIEAPIRALNLGEVTVIDADGKRLR